MGIGNLAISWSIRAALVAYFAALVLRMGRGCLSPGPRYLWLAGCACSWLHLAAVFHFAHNWSHQAATEHIAERTAMVVGWAFGAGIWFNYLFNLLWLTDALWWTLQPKNYCARPAWQNLSIHGFLLFMVVNATVVFETGLSRWLGTVGVLSVVLVFLFVRRSER